jgi:hypothetical protein
MMKIAVMGSAPSSRNLAPFHEPEWEIWACSPPNYDLPRIDAWFELHNLERKLGNPQNGPYAQVLAKHPRVYVIKADARVPSGIEFDWKHYVRKYGDWPFTSSVAWMLAHAIEQKPDKIGLWGVDMAAAEEYEYQKPGCQFFCWVAKQNGIGVYTPPQSDLLQGPPLYAVKEQWPMWGKHKARKQELSERLHRAEQAAEAADRDIILFKGALDDMRYQENTWIQPDWREFIKE